MARILTGIQSSGEVHLGNVLGAILPAIKQAENPKNEGFYFIADLHSMTSITDAAKRKEFVLSVAAAWLALGFNTEKNYFYRQSAVPEVCELAWYLNCVTPFPMLANAHSFKDKQENLSNVNAGLFSYPVLMAADILLYDAHFVPVGKDQKQHLEMTRDIAEKFNRTYGDTFVVPEPMIDDAVMTIPGTDGRKMSKSYNNYINIFLPEKDLKKKIGSIVTDATPLEAPKNPDTCNVFAIYSLLAKKEDVTEMRKKYEAGNYGYGHAKAALLSIVLDTFATARSNYQTYMNDSNVLLEMLQKGEDKARHLARKKLADVRQKIGY